MFAYQGGKNYIGGNSVKLLRDGEEFFPELIRCVRNANTEIFLETFILANDRVGKALHKAILGARKRGVWVGITVDSYGTFYLDDEYIQSLTDAGVVFQVYDPQPDWFSSRPKMFRRLHRKMAVFDNRVAFTGGINLCHDHMMDFGPHGKRDYMVRIEGPVVPQMRALCASYVRGAPPPLKTRQDASDRANIGDASVAFISRDNRRNRSEIEKAYLAAIRKAEHSITIANAYFFPGYRVMRALRKASRRGVKTRLILQGNPDIPFALHAARCLYNTLTRAGIEVYEYVERPLHAKIATIDDEWSTIGSSNLDPWSLAMNLEANVFVKASHLNRELNQCMEGLIEKSHRIGEETIQGWDWWQQARNTFNYHFVRRLPSLINWVPVFRPKIREIRSRFMVTDANGNNKQLQKKYPESKHAHRVLVKQDYEKAGEF